MTATLGFINPLLGNTFGSCCITEKDGQTHQVLCTSTGAEMIWSPMEAGTYEAAQAEHREAHYAVQRRYESAVSSFRYHRSWCRLVQCPACDGHLESIAVARAAYDQL